SSQVRPSPRVPSALQEKAPPRAGLKVGCRRYSSERVSLLWPFHGGSALRLLRRQLVHQLRPQLLNQLAHRFGDGFDAFELDDFLVNAFNLIWHHDPTFKDARFVSAHLL